MTPKTEPLCVCAYTADALDRCSNIRIGTGPRENSVSALLLSPMIFCYSTILGKLEQNQSDASVELLLAWCCLLQAWLSQEHHLHATWQDISFSETSYLPIKGPATLAVAIFSQVKTLIRIIISQEYIFGNYYFGTSIPRSRPFEQHVKHVHSWKKV